MKRSEKVKMPDNLPGCAVEFIKLVIKKMRYRKKVRADVQAELIAHFDDELRECKTDEEKQAKSEQLIAEFGDVKILGRMLRRAKKRCRPLWAKALVRSFQALGVFVLYVICVGVYLGAGAPTITVNYVDWLNDLARAGKADEENAKLYYDKATENNVKMPELIRDIHCKWPGDFNDIELQIFSKWLDDNKKAIELMRKGAEKIYCWSVYKSDISDLMKGTMMDNLMKPLSDYRRLAYLIFARISLSTYNGYIRSALSDCMVMEKFAGHMRGKGLVIEQLVAIAIEALAHKQVLMVLEKADVSKDDLKKLYETLEKQFSNQQVVVDLEAEKAFYYDFIQRGFTDDGKGSGRVLKRGVPLVVSDWKSALWRFITFSYPDRREVTAGIDKMFRKTNEAFEKTPFELRGNDQSVDVRSQTAKVSIMLKILETVHYKMGENVWRLKTDRAALLTVLAVLRYEKEKGEYPASLDELVVGEFLRKLPMDVYSDKSLVYRKADDGFILYSLGMDFDDDGGVPGNWGQNEEGGDQVFWPVKKR